jgi:hypothetical protein
MLKELTAANVDLYLDQGDTYYKLLTVKDSVGDVIDLTDLTVEVSVGEYFGSPGTIQLVGTIDGDPTLGKITLTMNESNSRRLNKMRYVYTVKLRSLTEVVKIMGGHILVTPTVLLNQEIEAPITGVESIINIGTPTV